MRCRETWGHHYRGEVTQEHQRGPAAREAAIKVMNEKPGERRGRAHGSLRDGGDINSFTSSSLPSETVRRGVRIEMSSSKGGYPGSQYFPRRTKPRFAHNQRFDEVGRDEVQPQAAF